MLEFFSSSTGAVNSKRAIAECLENALEGQNDLDCDLIIIYTSIGHNFKDMLAEARRLSPSAQLVGCTGCGVIGREGPNESMKALAIMAIKGHKDEFAVIGNCKPGNFSQFLGLNRNCIGQAMACLVPHDFPEHFSLLVIGQVTAFILQGLQNLVIDLIGHDQVAIR